MKILRGAFLFTILFVFSFISFSFGAEPEDPRWIKSSPLIHPRATYLRTCTDSPFDAIILDMNDYDIIYGDPVVIKRKGDYSAGGGFGDYIKDMVGVFSSSTMLLLDELAQQHRVPGAVPIPLYGQSVYTHPTYVKCPENEGDEPERLETDIPEDFNLSDAALIKIPARYLFISPNDSLFRDNFDPDQDYHVEFSDEVIWDSQSDTCNTCWDDKKNWDVNAVPIPEVGVTFGTGSHTEVIDAVDDIKYLLVKGGEVKFVIPNLDTTVCDAEKIPFIVYDGELHLADGYIHTCRGYIGYKGLGRLFISEEGWLMVDETITFGVDDSSDASLSVSGLDSLLVANMIYFGAEGSVYVTIRNRGLVESRGNINIGGQQGWSRADVTIKSGGGLLAAGRIHIMDQADVLIDGGGIAGSEIDVFTGGILKGCNSGIVNGPVFNIGGTVGPGCSTGKLIIDGDYTQQAVGTLVIEVGGYQQEDDYDVLEVTGNVTLDGTVQLDFINRFAPKKGDVFEFLQIDGTTTGKFSDVFINGLEDGFQYDISIEDGATKLTALNDGVSLDKFPWAMFLPAITGAGK